MPSRDGPAGDEPTDDERFVDDHPEAAALRRAHELGDLVNGRPENVAVVVPELAAMLAAGCADDVAEAVVEALGHAWDDRATAVLLAADLTAHPAAGVRRALAQALGHGLPTPALRADAVARLVLLSDDTVVEVRDWACFALHALHADGPEVRDALAARLDDPDGDTRDEALVALAATGDPRALARTAHVLETHDRDGITLRQLEAAVELASPELLPVLTEIAQEWAGDDDEHTALVARALRRSTPAAASLAAELEQQLVAGLDARLAAPDRAAYLTGRYPRTTLHHRGEHPDAGWWRRLWEHDDPDTVDVAREVESRLLAAP